MLDRQTAALNAVGGKRIYRDQLSGKDAARPGLTDDLDHLLEGDTLVVTELSRHGRSLQDLITIMAELRRRKVGFRSLHPPPAGNPARCSPIASCGTLGGRNASVISSKGQHDR
ncbi:MAG: recombinase family protein [Pseudonocardiaceae bacterium]